MSYTQEAVREERKTGAGSALEVALAWAVVGIPLLWGVSQVFIKSLALFRR